MHSPTQGLVKDVHSTFRERSGKNTKEVIIGRQFLTAMLTHVQNINPTMAWLHIAHSRGGATTYNIIQGMTDEQKALVKDSMYFLGLGSAQPMPLEFGRKVTNVYSQQDFITRGFALKYRSDPNYDIQFVRCASRWGERTAYIADHARLGKTYSEVQEDYILNLKQIRGFHNVNLP